MREGGDSYRERKRRRVDCPECDLNLTAGSLPAHLRTQHGHVENAGGITIDASIGRAPAQYRVSFPIYCPSLACPVEGCSGRANARAALRAHFMYKHVRDTLVILEEGNLPRCERCDMFVPYMVLNSRHPSTTACQRGAELKAKRAAVEVARRAREVVFTARGVPLDSVETFKYLSRPLSSTDDDWPALHLNLVKARKRWATVFRVLVREGASPRVSGLSPQGGTTPYGQNATLSPTGGSLGLSTDW
jgi:hypothetical protein